MKNFKGAGQRVMVTSYFGIKGKCGTVSRMCISDNSAWVTMDEDLPEDLVSFPDTDDKRHRAIRLDPDECEPVDNG